MPSPHLRRGLLAVGAAACLAILAACGGNGTPNASPSDTDNGQVQVGDVTSTPTGQATTPATGTTTTTPPASINPYPSSPKDYGLKFLAAIKSNDQTKIVDFSNVSVYSDAINNYNAPNFNGSWTYSNCAGGFCYYYNAVGNTAQVQVDNSQLGKAHAVTYVFFDAGSFENDVSSYVSAFVTAWTSGSKVGMNARATDSAVSAMSGLPMPVSTLYSTVIGCGSGQQCIDVSHETSSNIMYGPCIRFIVQTNRLGKADAVISAKADSDCDP
ncbi:MAG TPA: hypothetical protein VH561_08295 [Micromonosporaceae bacterium]|jgi:hypothetical protein